MVLDVNNPVEWQIRDDKYPILMPWYTHNMLKFLKTLPLDQMRILEYGGGWSTVWWVHYAKEVFTVESNEDWARNIADTVFEYRQRPDKKLSDSYLGWEPVNEGDQGPDSYNYIHKFDKMAPFDIVVVDGILRNECMENGIRLLKESGGGLLIADNWQQDYVWISEAAEKIVEGYDGHCFIQPDHTNHEGRPWQTCYWKILP